MICKKFNDFIINEDLKLHNFHKDNSFHEVRKQSKEFYNGIKSMLNKYKIKYTESPQLHPGFKSSDPLEDYNIFEFKFNDITHSIFIFNPSNCKFNIIHFVDEFKIHNLKTLEQLEQKLVGMVDISGWMKKINEDFNINKNDNENRNKLIDIIDGIFSYLNDIKNISTNNEDDDFFNTSYYKKLGIDIDLLKIKNEYTGEVFDFDGFYEDDDDELGLYNEGEIYGLIEISTSSLWDIFNILHKCPGVSAFLNKDVFKKLNEDITDLDGHNRGGGSGIHYNKYIRIKDEIIEILKGIKLPYDLDSNDRNTRAIFELGNKTYITINKPVEMDDIRVRFIKKDKDSGVRYNNKVQIVDNDNIIELKGIILNSIDISGWMKKINESNDMKYEVIKEPNELLKKCEEYIDNCDTLTERWKNSFFEAVEDDSNFRSIGYELQEYASMIQNERGRMKLLIDNIQIFLNKMDREYKKTGEEFSPDKENLYEDLDESQMTLNKILDQSEEIRDDFKSTAKKYIDLADEFSNMRNLKFEI